MVIKITAECDRCGLATDIPKLEDAIERAWGKKYVFCKKCAKDFDDLVELISGEDAAQGLLFNLWLKRGIEVGIMRNYKVI